MFNISTYFILINYDFLTISVGQQCNTSDATSSTTINNTPGIFLFYFQNLKNIYFIEKYFNVIGI